MRQVSPTMRKIVTRRQQTLNDDEMEQQQWLSPQLPRGKMLRMSWLTASLASNSTNSSMNSEHEQTGTQSSNGLLSINWPQVKDSLNRSAMSAYVVSDHLICVKLDSDYLISLSWSECDGLPP